MNREDLLDDVAELAGLESRDAAGRATFATLRTLGEHVSAGESADLAAKLPDDLADALTDRSDETPESFSVETFADRVAEREGREDVGRAAATVHVRAVMAALAGAGLERELQAAREQLPNEFATLFERDELATDAE